VLYGKGSKPVCLGILGYLEKPLSKVDVYLTKKIVNATTLFFSQRRVQWIKKDFVRLPYVKSISLFTALKR